MVLAASVNNSMSGEGVAEELRKKGATIPPCKESLPHRKILKKFLFEADMKKTILNASRKINNTL